VIVLPTITQNGVKTANKATQGDGSMERTRVMWAVTWVWETAEEILEDTDYFYAYDEDGALDQYEMQTDVPEGAKVVEVRMEG
jgi:hypothetical protein